MDANDKMHADAKHPFIIWTLQRTGGTNLTQYLLQRAKFPRPEHEPFNRQREYGHVTRGWDEHADRVWLNTEIEKICADQPCIKHCVEPVPGAISEALARASVNFGYRHLFLYRRNSLQRLLSVEYARRTGIWGLRHLTDVERDDHAFADPLDVRKLVRHDKRCIWMLQSAWDLLVSLGVNPRAVAYEDIYESDVDDAEERVLSILQYLELSKGTKADKRLVESVRSKGYQGTRSRYSRFENIDLLARRLDSGPRFKARDRAPIGWRMVAPIIRRIL